MVDYVATSSYYSLVLAVGIKTLKNKLSEYVRRAAAGEVVLVTDRERVVAELRAPAEGRSPLAADSFLMEMMRNGWITPPSITDGSPPTRNPMMTRAELSAALDEDRADR